MAEVDHQVVPELHITSIHLPRHYVRGESIRKQLGLY